VRDAPYARPVKKFPRNEFFEAPVVRVTVFQPNRLWFNFLLNQNYQTAGGGFYMHDDRVEDEEPAYSEAPKELTTGNFFWYTCLLSCCAVLMSMVFRCKNACVQSWAGSYRRRLAGPRPFFK
jgi:hypothetical protein